jgi:putative DNA primase/helicase
LLFLIGLFLPGWAAFSGFQLFTWWVSLRKGFRSDADGNVTIGTLIRMAKPTEGPLSVQVDAPPAGTLNATDNGVQQAQRVMNDALERARNGQHLIAVEQSTIEALATIKRNSVQTYEKTKLVLKDANAKVAMGTIDRLVGGHIRSVDGPATHHTFAKSILRSLKNGQWSPVSYEGVLYVLDAATNIWVRRHASALAKLAAEMHNGAENCTRKSDYQGIAEHAVDISASDDFFSCAAVGLACRDSFFRISANEIVVEPLTPDHRQRVRLPFLPAPIDTPLFKAFLHDTFRSSAEHEEEEQVRLLQEVCGAVMTGILARYQKAVLFYDLYGRSGKGTMERIMKELVPDEFIAAVSPFKWEDEYYVVQLAGARFNVVGELPDNKPLPANSFKTILGGDPVTGRHPYQAAFKFRNEAAHLFMSNHLINSTEHSEAFFARWLALHFPNSLLASGKLQDSTLPDRIIAAEMPGIAYWALEGARRVLHQRGFSPSRVHERLIATWRRRNSSLEEFIHEECSLGADLKVKRSEFYARYKVWCEEAGRRPFSKAKAKELLEANLPLRIKWASRDGYEVFLGVALQKPAEDDFNI